jgi:hypothetical protein
MGEIKCCSLTSTDRIDNMANSRFWCIRYGSEAYDDDADCMGDVTPKMLKLLKCGLPGVQLTTFILRNRDKDDWYQWYDVYALVMLEEEVSADVLHPLADVHISETYTLTPLDDVYEFVRRCSLYARDRQFVLRLDMV